MQQAPQGVVMLSALLPPARLRAIAAAAADAAVAIAAGASFSKAIDVTLPASAMRAPCDVMRASAADFLMAACRHRRRCR
jgi:hypothetical protein